MSTSWTIEPLTLADHPAAAALWARCQHLGVTPDQPGEWARYLARNPGLSMGARLTADTGHLQGTLVGAVLCGHDGRRGLLNHLAVDDPWRSRGIGRALVERALAGLQREGITRCNILVFADNTIGQAFWQQAGWRQRRDLELMQIDLPSVAAGRGPG